MHDTYFVVGHFHYVLSMGAVFALFAGFYYWFGKMCGYQYSEVLGRVHFWTTFLGVNITFLPMHFLGLAGMPRRVPDYPDAYIGWNVVASYGSLLSLVGTFVFFYMIYNTLTAGERCGANPWLCETVEGREHDAEEVKTLEWLVDSPPAFHTFDELPQIKDTTAA
jgi:cytochrome c oxidase subunit 1